MQQLPKTDPLFLSIEHKRYIPKDVDCGLFSKHMKLD
jgi:hypothetical protein